MKQTSQSEEYRFKQQYNNNNNNNRANINSFYSSNPT